MWEREVSATHEGIVAVFIPIGASERSAAALYHELQRTLTVSDSSDDTTNAELDTSLVAVDGGNLNNDTETHDNYKDAMRRSAAISERLLSNLSRLTSSKLDHAATTELVTEEETNDGTSETSELVDGGVGSLKNGSYRRELVSRASRARDD